MSQQTNSTLKASGPLAGLRVLDMTRVVAGPFAGQILGDLGAEVVKVERTGEGDDSRRVGPPWMKDGQGTDTEESTYFQSVNRNKYSINADFSKPEGARLLQDLAASADVLIENYRTGTLARYGLGYEALKERNPRLIYCSLTGFGQSGPYSDRSGYDYLIQAMSGLMSVTGWPDDHPGGGPMRVGVPIADICAGLYMVIAVLAAVNHRHTSGTGQYIDLSLFDAQLSVNLNAFSAWFNSGASLGRTGNDHPSASPYGVYEVDDGHILIATFNDREFGRLANLVGHPEWIEDARFSKMGARVENRKLLAQLLTDALRGRGKDEWVELLNAGKVSCGPINEMADVERDPQVHARGLVIEQPHPVSGRVRTIANPMRFSATPVNYRLAPPVQGAHTEDVLRRWLGADDADLALLRNKRVI